MDKKIKWIWLADKCGVGSSEMIEVYHKFESIDEIYLANYDDYSNFGVSERLSESLCDKSLDKAKDIFDECKKMNVEILTLADKRYPESLRSIKDPPAVLYCLGELPDFNEKLCVSVVGTRKMSEYGMSMAYKIAYEIASANAVVVSGMALGIDSVAHCATIAAGGKTVAVLGCGIDVVYPKAHTALREKIIESGAIITEFPPKTKPYGFHFPMRNRIISAMTQGTIVIDASVDSGSMITARNAILQGRDVFAVPSNIGSENSEGTNLLIKEGAGVVTCGSDIIKHYFFVYRDAVDLERLNEVANKSDFDPKVLLSLSVKPSNEWLAKNREATKNDKIKMPAKKKKAEEQREESVSATKVSVAVTSVTRGDASDAALASLSEKHRKVFDEMPLDKAVSTDYLVKAGFKLADVIAALTVLEIKGLISSLPGSLYIRK